MILKQFNLISDYIATYINTDQFRQEVEKCCIWLEEELKINLKGRIPEYKRIIYDFQKLRGNFDSNLFYYLHSFYEMKQIVYIYKWLSSQKTEQFLETLKESIHGASFRDLSVNNRNQNPRNYLFELIIGSELSEANFNIDMSQRTDIIVETPSVYIECKRLRSSKQLYRRAKEAIDQVKDDIAAGSELFVYIDVTEIFNDSHTVIVLNETEFPLNMLPPISKEDLDSNFLERVDEIIMKEILEYTKDLEFLTKGYVGGIILIYNFIGYHISIYGRSLISGSARFLICNDEKKSSSKFIKGNFNYCKKL